MIAQTAVWLFDLRTCTPIKRSHTSIGGPTIPLRQPRSNRGKHWSWSGSIPHDTRMHAYAGLTTGQKTAWKDLADQMLNDHSAVTPPAYSGANAYMIVNLYRRLNGDPYTDDAPTGPQPSADLTAIVAILASDPRTFAIELTE